MPVKTLLIATANPGKIAELRQMLGDLPIMLTGLGDFENITEVAETGATFEENARLKATGYARQTGLHSLADDSGLEVAALDGRPGVLSARYGGDDVPFAEKIRMLLSELRNTGSDDRRARFVCSIALAGPDGSIINTTDGICTGRLADSPRGTGGFGYDPVFIPDGFDQTFGELPSDVKGQISHRGAAFLQIMPILRDFFAF